MNSNLNVKKEFGRKILHILVGSFFIITYYFNFISRFQIFLILVFSGILSYIQKRVNLPVITFLVKNFGRKKEEKFPGKGFILFLIGTLLTFELFPKNIALASLSVLVFGDSFSHVFSILNNSMRFKIKKRKSLVGYLVGMFMSVLVSIIFVPFSMALIGAVAALTLELFEIKIEDSVLDDNVFVPIVAGTSMMLLSHYFLSLLL